MEIRDARDDDWAGIWPVVAEVLAEVLAEGDAYTYDPDMTEDEGRGKCGSDAVSSAGRRPLPHPATAPRPASSA